MYTTTLSAENKRMAIKHPASSLGFYTGMTQRDGMGREEGGGFRMGNTCMPVVDSF